MACITLNAFSWTSDVNYSSLNHGNRKSPLCHIVAVAIIGAAIVAADDNV